MYRIYGKLNSRSRFQALDAQNGTFAGNLIYASMWESREAVTKDCKELTDNNPHMKFEVRKI